MRDSLHVVVAPDKFKGSLSAAQVAQTVTTALKAVDPCFVVAQHPIADGGEGTVALALANGFRPVTAVVDGPMGRRVAAIFAIRDEVAVVEMASAAGLALLSGQPDRHSALNSSTFGVGELILAAAEAGATRIVVGAGGSATTDGGAGAVEALGIDVAALNRTPVHPDQSPTGLAPRLSTVDLVVACDVDNPLLGSNGAAEVYAPQKGADAEAVRELERRLTNWADNVAATHSDARSMPGAGAAGGLAFGLMALAGARIVSGVEMLLELTRFDQVVDGADLVIVGEGSLDHQSLRGKGPIGVARAAAAKGVDVVAIAGRNQLTEREWRSVGLSSVYALSDVEPDERKCMRDAQDLLHTVARSLADDWLPPGAGAVSETVESTRP